MRLAFMVYRGHVGSNSHQGVDHLNLYQKGKRNKICTTETCPTLRFIHKSAKAPLLGKVRVQKGKNYG